MSVKLSNYANSLSAEVHSRYCERLKALNLKIDPFILEDIGKNKLKWYSFKDGNGDIEYPKIDDIDIYKYFVERLSFYTTNQVKAYKSLESYNFFISGHVRNVRWAKGQSNGTTKFLILADVLHSQKINEKPAQLWLIAEECGEIYSSHCKCVAGQAESCSHVAAVCYYFLFYNNKCQNTSVTDVKAYWMQPSAATVSPKKVQHISYENVKRKVKKLIDGDESKKLKRLQPVIKTKNLPVKVDDVKTDPFMQQVAEAYPNSALLKLIPPFCVQMAAKNDDVFPKTFGHLYNEEYKSKTLEELISLGLDLNISLTAPEIKAVEKASVNQASNRLWFAYRTGRITASIMHTVCNTRSITSNMSIIKKICHPKKSIFFSAATEWGCRHEKAAVQAYLQRATSHQGLEFRKCGLFIHPEYPFIAASPDGVLTCKCCGVGGVEIKCPFCLREKSLSNLQYLDNDSGEKHLARTHPYYYQVITQIHTVGMSYCDFVVWSPHEQIFVERIHPDQNTWKVIVEKARYFFHNAVIPELMARYFSDGKHQGADIPISGPSSFCICKQNMQGKTIICSKEGCSYVKYHMKCVSVKRKIRNWVCPNCKTDAT